MKIALLLSLFMAAALLASCSHGPPVPFEAFDFTVEDLFTGEEIHLADYRGQPVLIYFFASW
jgi:cytochrome oxidase Cu insertion factor (SCO1/SenC/PrrC family)